MKNSDFESEIKAYYSEKIEEFGVSAKGVDWNGVESQHARFRILLKHLNIEPQSTILDFGCGYGELLAYLKSEDYSLSYLGYDIVKTSIDAAKRLHSDAQADFVSVLPEMATWDFVVMSGVFNVKGEIDEVEWCDYVISKINSLLPRAHKGMSFNMLTTHNDAHFRKETLYYVDPMKLLSKLKISPPYTVILDHSYPMWEYTVTITK
jgi:cyclopropane fatty-acyl-phospholipid synthase-like methyltransferase